MYKVLPAMLSKLEILHTERRLAQPLPLTAEHSTLNESPATMVHAHDSLLRAYLHASSFVIAGRRPVRGLLSCLSLSSLRSARASIASTSQVSAVFLVCRHVRLGHVATGIHELKLQRRAHARRALDKLLDAHRGAGRGEERLHDVVDGLGVGT